MNVKNNDKHQDSVDYDKPVAYDAEGRPLYAHPPHHDNNHTQFVHMTRVAEPEKIEISPTMKLKHDRSKRSYPSLNLSANEYVVKEIKRHPIGLLPSLMVGVFLLALAIMMLFNYELVFKALRISIENVDPFWIAVPILGFIGLVALGMYVAYYIYTNNRLYLTNESVVQEIQTGLFYRTEQTASLANIEDASYTQEGLIEQMFNFGSIRLSTQGDETTYQLSYVVNPKESIAILNNAVESFKNGRPIEVNN